MRADPVAALAEALRLWARNPLALMALWLPAALAGGAASWAAESYRQAQGLPLDPFAMTDAQRLQYFGVALPLAMATVALELTLWGVVAAWVAGRRGRLGTLSAAGARAGAFVALGLLLAFALGVGLALLVIPFFVLLHWFLFAPAALAEGKSVPAALAASRAFARERRTYGFTALVVLAWLAVLVAQTLLAGVLGPLLQLAGAPPGHAQAVAFALAAWPFAPLLPLLPAAYWFLAQDAPAPAPPPAPDASPAERFRTTKCPQCGTLVPYTATGQPVDVACPVCGRAGRVL